MMANKKVESGQFLTECFRTKSLRLLQQLVSLRRIFIIYTSIMGGDIHFSKGLYADVK